MDCYFSMSQHQPGQKLNYTFSEVKEPSSGHLLNSLGQTDARSQMNILTLTDLANRLQEKVVYLFVIRMSTQKTKTYILFLNEQLHLGQNNYQDLIS